MQSRTSYFNKTLFRRNLTRFWPLWGGASFLGALAPLFVLVQILQARFELRPTSLEVTQGYYSILTYAVPPILLVYAVLCALAVWSYLYSARSVGMMHTLPMNRKGLFLTNFLSGMAMLLIPFAVTGLLCVAVTAMAGAMAPVGLGVTILGVLGLSLFYFASATLVAFVTGNVFAMPALYFIAHFLAAALDWLLGILASGFYYGVSDSYTGTVEWLSPTIYLMRKVFCNSEYADVPVPGENWSTRKLVSVTLENGWLIGVYALVGAVLLALAWLLYQRRRSESAGDVVAVGWMKPVFRYGVALCAAMSGGMALYALFWSGFQRGDCFDAAPMSAFMALSGLIGYYIASMLLAKSLRVFRRSWPGAAAVVLGAALLCCAVSFDILGVEKRIPDAGQVTAVNFHIYGHGSCDGTTEEPEAIQTLLSLHEAVLREKDLYRIDRSADEDTYYANLYLNYELSNGRSLRRSYSLQYRQSDLERAGSAMDSLAEAASSPVLQRVNLLEGGIQRFTAGEVPYYDRQSGQFLIAQLDAAAAQTLYDAIVRDVDAGHFGKTMFLEDEWEQKIFDDYLYLYYIRQAENAYTSSMPLRLSVYCTETLQVLRDMGVLNEDRLLLTQAEAWALQDQKEAYGYPMDSPAVEAVVEVGIEVAG